MDNTPEYSGSVIDLSTFQIASLYHGSEKQFLADSLSARGLSGIVSQERGLWYATWQFRVSEETLSQEDIWLEFRANIHAANLYLNGNLLVSHGVLQPTAPAKAGGKNIVRRRIPREWLVPGHNQIELEFTNYKRVENTVIRDLSLGKYQDFQRQTAIMTTAPILFLGIFLFVVLINGVLYFSLDRKKVFLLLALLFLVNSLSMLYEVLYWNGLVPAASSLPSYAFRSGLEYLAYALLLIILFYEFAFTKRVMVVSALIFLVVYLLAVLININAAIALSLLPFGLSCSAVRERIKNSMLITGSLLLLVLLNYLDDRNALEDLDFIQSNYILTSLVFKLDSLGMMAFALVMIFISANSILTKSKSLSQANLKLERLEYQFLQKLILPHFMVNSLMSLQQLVLTAPETARKMIGALSEEFHLLASMSKKKLVPIEQEIDICRAHLHIMGIQQKADYALEVRGMVGGETIPPTVIHTLVENGLTHGYSGSQNARFVLSREVTATSTVYRLFNDGHTKADPSFRTTGTGLKYVEARLEECYPGKWQLDSRKVDEGWESVIEIRHRS
ncbi:MAG TPA: hypothetical protein DCR93_37785 [Cytophagales bacterium]|nr:hypothetical protein [Cytophagales bacterium]HAP64996.1 hypothetical protein [Cytophagales bacterium]